MAVPVQAARILKFLAEITTSLPNLPPVSVAKLEN
jgi:hypothetical protein